MREDKHRRKYRQRESASGPSLISKEAVPQDSSEIFACWYNRREWEKRLEQHETAGLFRADPFGVNDYFVDFSLNKKQRWKLKEEIKERIEEVQDPALNVRVSASVHGCDRSRLELPRDPREGLHCLEYHDVSRDLKNVTHKQSENGRTRLKTLTNPARPCRKTKGKRRASRYRECWDYNGRDLPFDEKLKYQPLHVHYTTIDYSDRPSMHNKETNRFSRTKRSRSRDRQARNRKIRDSPLVVEIDDDVVYDDVVIIDDVIIDEPFSVPTVVDDLSELVVVKEKRKKEKKVPIHRFVDELLKASLCVPTTSSSGYGSEEEEEFTVDEIPSSPTIPLVSLPHEMFTRIPISSLPNLSSIPRLPCYPPSWEIHQRETLEVLGRSIPTCVIARQYGDELRLSIVETCLSSIATRRQLPPLVEIPPKDDIYVHDWCEICYDIMDSTSEDRFSHPFSLSCSHLFCTGCWLSHISQSIHSMKLPAACLDPTCSCTLSVSAASSLLSSSSHELYENSTIEALKNAEKIVVCPECKRIHHTQGSLLISCPCGTSLCGHCSSVNHSPLSCDVFEQYNSYMRKSGFVSVYSASGDAPIVRNLVKCPTCSALMQRSDGCNHMSCSCGAEFCYECGKAWTSSHYSCTAGSFMKITLVDVFNPRSDTRLLVPSLLTLAIESRTILLERRKELKKRLSVLPVLEKRKVERTFVKLSLIMELCYLNFRRNRRSKLMADKVRFGIENFFNSGDKHLAAKGRALVEFHDTLFA